VNDLARHYSRFRVGERLLLTGHSHQAWPDVALQGQIDAFLDAAEGVGAKWGKAFEVADRVRDGFRALLGEPGADIALGQNTHELVLRFLSALDLRARPRLITSDGEFHTLRRQLARLGEVGVELVVVPTDPVETLAERMAARIDERTAAVLVSAVLFGTSAIVPELDHLAENRHRAELLVDAYHAIGAMPFAAPDAAWVVGGGYKYLELGEGNCFLRLPAHAQELRPVLTGWYAEFGELAVRRDPGEVGYATGSMRFAGATYDPTSNYRAARVFDFFAEHGLTPEYLRESYLRQTTLLAEDFDKLNIPDEVATRDRSRPRSAFGGFLAIQTPHAARWQEKLAERGVDTDSRGNNLRFGPAPYLRDDQLHAAMAALGEIVAEGGH
jgi:kynureninase